MHEITETHSDSHKADIRVTRRTDGNTADIIITQRYKLGRTSVRMFTLRRPTRGYSTCLFSMTRLAICPPDLNTADKSAYMCCPVSKPSFVYRPYLSTCSTHFCNVLCYKWSNHQQSDTCKSVGSVRTRSPRPSLNRYLQKSK